MNEYIKILFLVIACCLLASMMKEIKREYSLIIVILCGISVLLYCASDMRVIIEQFRIYSEIADINEPAIKIFLKAVGISVVCQFACEICADSNNRFLQFCVELSGKTAILLTSIPLISSVLKIVANYIGV